MAFPPHNPTGHSVEFHFLGTLPFSSALALQARLVYEAQGRADGQIHVVMCEHESLITIGRRGSRADIRFSGEELRRRGLAIRYVGRSGGTVLHGPGQLALYPIVPLAHHGLNRRRLERLLEMALVEGLTSLGFSQLRGGPAGLAGVWGRTGLIAPFGLAVRGGVSSHGVFLNVHPLAEPMRFIDADLAALGRFPAAEAAPQADPLRPRPRAAPSSLVAESRRRVTIPHIRAALVEPLAAALGASRYHIHSHHPLVRETLSRLGGPARS